MQLISLSNRKSAIFWQQYERLYSHKRVVIIRFCYKNIILCIGKFNILSPSLDTFRNDGFCNRTLDTLARKTDGIL